jgi:hypothetical protein
MGNAVGSSCGICLEAVVDPYVLDCGHTFCRDCINEYRERGVNDWCPYCRAPLPPGVEVCLAECKKLMARIPQYMINGQIKQINVTMRCVNHYALKAVNADPNHAMAHYNLGISLTLFRDCVDICGATRAYRETTRLAPNHAPAHFSLGYLLHYGDDADYGGAMREYRESIRCDPDLAMAYINLGLLLYNAAKDKRDGPGAHDLRGYICYDH